MKKLPFILAVLLCVVSFGNSLPVQKQTAFFVAKPASGGGGGGPALVFSTIAYGTPSGCTTAPATNTTSATFMVIAVRGYRSPYPLASSSPATPFVTNGISGIGSGGCGSIIYYTNNPATSSSQTFSADGGDTGTTSYSGVGALGFTGITTFVNSSSNVLTGDVIHPTATVTAKVFVAVLSAATDALPLTFSVDSGFTIQGQGDALDGSGNPFHFVVACKVSSSATTEQPTFTRTAGSVNPAVSVYLSGFN